MLYKMNLEYILFLDIETVPQYEDFRLIDAETQELWAQKTDYHRKDGATPEAYYDRAGIWAEFGKIVCISVGYFKLEGETKSFRVTTFKGDEPQLLEDFKTLLENHFGLAKHMLCAHNGKEFDFPYIARRMIIHGITLPYHLDLFGKKPWEVNHLDTMDLWKFGDYKNYTSLKLLAKVLGIASPKEDIDGSMVRDVYYKDKDVDRIVRYCELDVITTAQVFLRLRNEPLLNEAEIKRIEH
ncbi:3'-5' exonuclease [Maribacter chungangensis]|uniref:3'-5' exonuclease n=1 Tax=Maribacter chungangensis TaxID=1069117 RepID=A0ABW3AYJ0_9FLAO